jgi:histidinol-phosphate phosphatase family protein
MRAIFLDRDGVICENRSDYVKSWSEFQFLPEVKNSLAALSRLGLPIIVVTNQSIVNRGIVSNSVIDDIHQHMIADLAAHGGRIDRVIYCPHHPEDNCDCRKPKPGMLLQMAREMKIDLTHSYLVGDATTDLVAARQVGCRTFLVLTGRGFQQLMPALRLLGNQVTIARNLMGATHHILEAELGITDGVDQSNLAYTKRYRQPITIASNF